MPITKCEASKATPAKAIEYILDPEKVIAQGSQGFVSERPEEMAKQMMQTMHLFGKGFCYEERKYYHAKVSFHPSDRPENGGNLTPECANEYATQYAEKIWPDREVVWSVQDHGSSIHIHFIVAACAQSTGTMLDARNAQYRGWKDYANTLVTEYGLSTLDWRKATREKRAREKNPKEAINDTFAETGLRSRGVAVWKDELRHIIDEATKECCSLKEFQAFLKTKGVVLPRLTEQTISYKLQDHKACRGDSLGGDYTLMAIRDALKRNVYSQQYSQFDEINLADRNKFRQWGRMAGMKREDVDKLCDTLPQMTWPEKQACWEEYKEARDMFWPEYEIRKNHIKQKLDYAYEMRRRAKEAEWILIPYNRRRSLGTVIFAGIYLHKYGGSEKFDACIEELKRQQETLRRDARQFKKYSNTAVSALKSKTVSLEEYTDALLFMQTMAEDICKTGSKALEYWAKEYEKRHQLRLPGTLSLEELLKNSEKRTEQEEGLYQIKRVDWTKLP